MDEIGEDQVHSSGKTLKQYHAVTKAAEDASSCALRPTYRTNLAYQCVTRDAHGSIAPAGLAAGQQLN